MSFKLSLVWIFVVTSCGSMLGAAFKADFNDGFPPPNTTLLGTATISPSSGVNGTSALQLTDNARAQGGTWIINDFNGGNPVDGFVATFKVQVGPGSAPPADGFSFSLAPNVNNSIVGEDGAAVGLAICFDTFGQQTDPSLNSAVVEARWNGVPIGRVEVPKEVLYQSRFIPVTVRMTQQGLVDVVWDENLLIAGATIPVAPEIATPSFIFGARTGDLTELLLIDDVEITIGNAGPFEFALQPRDAEATVGGTVYFRAKANQEAGMAYQWLRNGAPIAGKTSDTLVLTVASAADDGAKFSLKATNPLTNFVSEEAILHVIEFDTSVVSPQIDFNFDSGLPAGTQMIGSATVEPSGGVGGSGNLQLTPPAAGVSGTWILSDFWQGKPIEEFTVSFALRIGDPSAPPADGLCMAFTPNFPATGLSEEGTTNGLSLNIDTFNNAGNEAPAFELRWNGAVVGARAIPVEKLTGPNFIQIFLHMKKDGRVDLLHDGMVICRDAPSGYQPISGGSWGFSARTGSAFARHSIDNFQIRIPLSEPARFTLFSMDPLDPGHFLMEWTGEGLLEASETVTGPWEPIVGAASPYSIEASMPARFFRIRNP